MVREEAGPPLRFVNGGHSGSAEAVDDGWIRSLGILNDDSCHELLPLCLAVKRVRGLGKCELVHANKFLLIVHGGSNRFQSSAPARRRRGREVWNGERGGAHGELDAAGDHARDR
jgi:hypothetical protein